MDILQYTLRVLFFLIITFRNNIQATSPKDYYGSPIVLDDAIIDSDQCINMYTLPKSRIIVSGTSPEFESALNEMNPKGR